MADIDQINIRVGEPRQLDIAWGLLLQARYKVDSTQEKSCAGLDFQFRK